MTKLGFLLAVGLLAGFSSQALNVGFISFHSADNAPSGAAAAAGFTSAPDVGYTSLLQANGHAVTRIVTADNAGLNADLLNAFDVLLISRSVPSGHYQTADEAAFYNGLTVPTMIMSGYLLRNSRLGFTAGGTIPDTVGNVTLQAQDPLHPIFAGLSLDGANQVPYATSIDFLGTIERGISVNTDALAGMGTVLATVGTAGDPAFGGMVIGEWQAGDTTVTGNTLGGPRMVFLTGTREHSGLTSEGAGIFDLTPAGAQIFLNAVNYMAVPEPSVGWMLLPGLLLLAWRVRRHSRQQA